jgi:hypothetical protein
MSSQRIKVLMWSSAAIVVVSVLLMMYFASQGNWTGVVRLWLVIAVLALPVNLVLLRQRQR